MHLARKRAYIYIRIRRNLLALRADSVSRSLELEAARKCNFLVLRDLISRIFATFYRGIV